VRISVVIPSYRRPDELRRCLQALERQERAADEIIVVHRATDMATANAAAQVRGLNARLVIVDRPGVLAAMEAGVRAATGDVIAFTDDDAAPRVDWVSRIHAGLIADQRLGAIGGRDYCWYGSRLVVEGHHARVGRVQWFGRLTSGHHAGAGPPQDVHVLKGCNMAVRRQLLTEIGFDPRMRGGGAQTHYELSLFLQARRSGWILRYDPAIAVDHYPAARHDLDQREQPARQAVEDGGHNETLALLEHLRWPRRAAFIVWAIGVGTQSSPGMVQAARRRAVGDGNAAQLFRSVMRGRYAGLRTHLRRPSAAPMFDGLVVVVHSPSGTDRAQQLFGRRRGARIIAGGRSVAGVMRMLRAVAGRGTRGVYLIDIGLSTVVAAAAARTLHRRVVLDTGDLAFELARSLGRRGPAGVALIWLGERAALAMAHHVVVRGTAHVAHLPGKQTTVIRDLPPAGARPSDGSGLRRELRLEHRFVVGLVGSLNLAPRLGIGYGWDLIEALALCDESIAGLVVGDGPGRRVLEARADELGVADRVRFVGTLDPSRTMAAIGAMDVAISTQTNDDVGAVRTTGKLPLYLACGCPVLATHVGEAALLLGPLGWTLPYAGTVDREYPARLARAVQTWSRDPAGQAQRGRLALRTAANSFDCDRARDSARAALNAHPASTLRE
jgi:GT2 family glycosyltransferase